MDGRQPGGVLGETVRIGGHGGNGHHIDGLQAAWSPVPGGASVRIAHLGGIEPAHVLDVAPKWFRESVRGGLV